MNIIHNKYIIQNETYLKGMILTNGIIFTQNALNVALIEKAKIQNQVYNMPINSEANRPQELIITNRKDNYSTVVSCVSPVDESKAVIIDADYSGELLAIVNKKILDDVVIHYVQEPTYYHKRITNGELAKKYVSACGLDELDILPWKGCSISKPCRFCGVNNYIRRGDVTATAVASSICFWNKRSYDYLRNLQEAINIALKDACYKEHFHLILIAGNLANDKLDLECRIFSEIAQFIMPLAGHKSREGIVVVISPPNDINLLRLLKNSGVTNVVFNLEAVTEEGFKKYCPGKNDLGFNYFMDRLNAAVDIFGKGHVWSNLVLGLESVDLMLPECEALAEQGVVMSANVLHFDKGNTLDCGAPQLGDIVNFFFELEKINSKHNFIPFYCAKALRTSLTNEAHKKRIVLK